MRSLRTATKSSSCSQQLEKARAQQRRRNTAKKTKNQKQTHSGNPLWGAVFLNLNSNGRDRKMKTENNM